jgi:hypothetical protein
MTRIRRFFARLSLRAGETSIIRGICRQIHRYGDRRYAEGLKDGGRALRLIVIVLRFTVTVHG